MNPQVIVDGEYVDIQWTLAEGSVFCASLNDEELDTLIRKLIKARAMDRTERREIVLDVLS